MLLLAALTSAFLGGLAALLWTVPVLADGWVFVIDAQGRPVTLASIVEFARENHAHANPRLGEIFNYVAHARAPVHVLMTTAVVASTLLAMFVFAHGAWPRPSEARDRGRLLILVGLFCLGVPTVGQMLLYRPFTTNYVYGFAFQLWLAVPYRLALARPSAHGAARPGASAPRAVLVAAGALVLGGLAGFCNEHTGPAELLAIAWITVELWRRDRRPRAWAIAGLVGLAAGYLFLLTAPGQSVRYGGLAEHTSVLERVLERGLTANAARLGMFLAGAAVPILVLGGAALAVRRRPDAPREWRRGALLLAGVALVMALTVLASPKLGFRLYYAPSVLLVIAAALALDASVRGRTGMRVLAVIAGGVWIFFAVQLTRIQLAVAREAHERVDLLRAAPPGSIAVVPPFTSYQPSWWAYGDDFRAPQVRERVARHFGLRHILVDTRDPADLRTTGVTLSLVQLADPLLADEAARARADRDGDGFSGRLYDREGLDRTVARFRAGVDRLAAATDHRLRWAALATHGLDFGARAGRPLYVASWRDGTFRLPDPVPGTGTGARTITLADAAWPPGEAYLIVAGAEAVPVTPVRAGGHASLRYAPWRAGGYLLVSCEPQACHVLATADHRGGNAAIPATP